MYQKCLSCQQLGQSCFPPITNLSASALLKWCKEYKKLHGLSNSKVAKMSGVPEGTISRLFSGEHLDLKYETARLIFHGLVGEYSSHQCQTVNPVDARAVERLSTENKELRSIIKDAQVRHSKEKNLMRIIIFVLAILLLVALSTIITALIYDRTSPGVGFFW